MNGPRTPSEEPPWDEEEIVPSEEKRVIPDDAVTNALAWLLEHPHLTDSSAETESALQLWPFTAAERAGEIEFIRFR